MEPVQLAAVLAGLVLLASMVSVELGMSVALLELALGVVAGNLFGLDANADWLVFIAHFAFHRADLPGRRGGRPRRLS